MTRPWREHRDEIAGRLAGAPFRLLCADFDGTLAPIVNHPALATMSLAIHQKLRAIAALPKTSVCVVSGRSLDDVRECVGIPELIVAGNHGLEIAGPGFAFVEPNAAAHYNLIQKLAREIDGRIATVSGAWLENKGLTLSVHVREVSPERRGDVRRIVESAVASLGEQFLCTAGLQVWEVRPRISWNKGAAVLWIADRLRQPKALIVCIGDDRTDEDAFAALPGHVTVKVGADCATKANYFLDGQADVAPFLDWLAQILDLPPRIANR
jgi:trehalose 6-phosphate phosphatase